MFHTKGGRKRQTLLLPKKPKDTHKTWCSNNYSVKLAINVGTEPKYLIKSFKAHSPRPWKNGVGKNGCTQGKRLFPPKERSAIQLPGKRAVEVKRIQVTTRGLGDQKEAFGGFAACYRQKLVHFATLFFFKKTQLSSCQQSTLPTLSPRLSHHQAQLGPGLLESSLGGDVPCYRASPTDKHKVHGAFQKLC